MLEDGRAVSVVLGAKSGGLPGGALYDIGEAYAVVGEAVVVFHGHGEFATRPDWLKARQKRFRGLAK